jgi:hypothetical protein|tara:strand:+ start:530 stop:724 length:195 start_codon:yes stop_codon:yes gene_type:complete
MADIESSEDMARHDVAFKAINELVPNSTWILRGWEYSDLEWKDETKTKPTETEFNTKVTALESA